MNEVEALAQIRGLARAGRVEYTRHALEEMGEASATRRDVETALVHAKTCRHQPAKDRWKVCGPDLDGDELTVVVTIEHNLIVVTVW